MRSVQKKGGEFELNLKWEDEGGRERLSSRKKCGKLKMFEVQLIWSNKRWGWVNKGRRSIRRVSS